jgi:ABC-type sugar transport system substrate-binding protein
MTESSRSTYQCPNCGAIYSEPGLKFCRVCGHSLAAAPAGGAGTVQPASRPAAGQMPQPPASAQMPQPPASAQAPAYGQPPAYPPGPGYVPVPGYPGMYAPPAPRRSAVPILAGIGALALVLVLAVVGAFAATGGFGGGGSGSPTPSLGATGTPAVPTPVVATMTPEPTETPSVGTHSYSDLVVGFIQSGSAAGWRDSNTASFKKTADQLGLTLKFYDSKFEFANQIMAFNAFIQDPSVNVIVLAAVQTTGYDDVLKAAKAAGKVVVLEDMKVEADWSLYYTYVGPDFVAEGEKSATAMCTLLEGMSGTKVFEIQGYATSQAAVGRAQGFRQKMGDCGISIEANGVGNWDPEIARTLTATYLASHTDTQGIFAHNDTMALGVIQAIEAAGLKPGQDVKVVGVDATAQGFQAMIAGKLGADVECSPKIAPQVYKAALDGLNGVTTTPKFIPTEETVFYASQGAAALQAILSTRDY